VVTNRFKLYLVCTLAALVTVVGCGSVSTQRKFYGPITAELHAGKPESSVALMEEAREKNKFAEKDRLLYFIDAGMLNHYAGNYQASIEKLQLAEAAAEELFTKSISRAAVSLLLNDNFLEYSGEDYEILYTNLINALNYIEQDDFDGAFVEIRRANLKLDLLEQKYGDAAAELQRGLEEDSNRVDIAYAVDEVRFYSDAFARYLSMHMYAADGKMDDARIDLDYLAAAFQTQPHIYDFVVGLAGLAPTKEPLRLRIRTDKDLDQVQILYDSPGQENDEFAILPIKVSADYYFKFAIPELKRRPSLVGSIRVLVDGNILGELSLIENVSNVAEETFNAKKSIVFIRSVARAVAKGLAGHQLKKKADTGGVGGWLKKAAIDVAADITEDADLRSSQFLPGMIYVGDFEIEPGQYDLTIEFFDHEGNFIEQTTFEGYQVLEKGLNMLRAYSTM